MTFRPSASGHRLDPGERVRRRRATHQARVAAPAARAHEQRAQRQRARTPLLLVGVVGLLLAAGAAFWATRDSDSPTASPPADMAAVSGHGAEAAPPWPAPRDVQARAAKAGLPLGAMGTAEHYHVHLDILVDGKPVSVPANIGVDPTTGAMSYLHTHTPDGLVHIEAGTRGQPFTLGQLFTQWDVRLAPTRLGGLRAGGGNRLAVYVNGKQVGGDPALVRLRPRQQITLVYGPADQEVDVPSSYHFAPGQ